ncbi:hypothetical protein ACV2X7_27735, partial [Escherichia coli]
YDELDDATRGAVNPLVGDALARLGYDARLTLAPWGTPEPAPDWRTIVTWGRGILSLSRPATLDVGALGKGRLVDRVLEVVRRRVDGDVIVDGS